MKRRNLLILLPAALVVLAGPALATQFDDEVVAQLSAQGFTSITKATTWLGRVHIYAERRDGHREIVLNPRTGEILRDIWTGSGGADASKPILDTVGDGSNSGSSGSGSGSAGGSDKSGSNSSSAGGTDGNSGSGSSGGGSSGGDSSGSGSSGSGSSGSDDSAGGSSGSDDSGGGSSGSGKNASGGRGSDSSGKDDGN